MSRPPGAKNKVKNTLDPHSMSQLEDTLKSLARSGASKFFYNIRKRRPGVYVFPYWKRNLPVEEIDDLRGFCYGEGGDDHEFKIEIRDGNGMRVVGPDGSEIPDSLIPSAREREQVKLPAPDPVIEDRRKELESKRQEVELMRQEAELERQRKRVKAARNGEDPDADDDDDYVDPRFLNPYTNPYMGGGMGFQGGGYVPPWMQNQQNQGSKREDTLLLALIEAIKGNRVEAPKESFFDVLIRAKAAGLLGGEQMGFKDMAHIFSPIMAEMGKIGAEGNKLLMQNLAESDRAFREKMLDLISATGADDDEISKWKRILNLANETVKDGIQLVLGRGHILGGGGKGGSVNVPVVKKPQPPGLPGPAPKAKPEEAGGGESPEIDAAKTSPREAAKRVIRERVEVFLVAHEQEMLIGSNPAWAADKLDEVWASFPEILRVKLESLEIGKIYETLGFYCPEIVQRILAEVEEDKELSRKKWCIDFWGAMKQPPEEEESEDEEEEEAGEEGDPMIVEGGDDEEPEVGPKAGS